MVAFSTLYFVPRPAKDVRWYRLDDSFDISTADPRFGNPLQALLNKYNGLAEELEGGVPILTLSARNSDFESFCKMIKDAGCLSVSDEMKALAEAISYAAKTRNPKQTMRILLLRYGCEAAPKSLAECAEVFGFHRNNVFSTLKLCREACHGGAYAPAAARVTELARKSSGRPLSSIEIELRELLGEKTSLQGAIRFAEEIGGVMGAPFPIRVASVPGKKLDVEILSLTGQPSTEKLILVVSKLLRRRGVVVAEQLRSEIPDLVFSDKVFSDLVHCLPFAASVSVQDNVIWSTQKSSGLAQGILSCFAVSSNVSLPDSQLKAALLRTAKAMGVELPQAIVGNVLSSLILALNIKGSLDNRSFPASKPLECYLKGDFERDLVRILKNGPLTIKEARDYRFKAISLNKIQNFLECSAFIEPVEGLGYRIIGSPELPAAPPQQGPNYCFRVRQSGALKIGLKFRVVYLPRSVNDTLTGDYYNPIFGKIRIHKTRILDLAPIADGIGIAPGSSFDLELNPEEKTFTLKFVT